MSEARPSDAENDAITDAAAQWCMRLHSQDCTTAEHVAFEQWLGADPRHAFEYKAMEEIWQVADHLPCPLGAQAFSLPERPRRKAWRTWAITATISVLAAPLVVWTSWNQGWLPNHYQHFEASHATRQVVLSDGSKVELNLGTELSYSNFKDERRVTLNKGEAFFDVSHDSQHPFVVKAADGWIKVTGTHFNVWKYEDQVCVTLIEGSVLVSSKDSSADAGFRLSPGMQARYKAGDFEPQLSQTRAYDTSLAWRNGKLILDNLSLNEALPLINRYLDTPLTVADSATGAIRISGIYDTASIRQLVSALPRVLPLYLTQKQDGSTVLNSISPAPQG